MHDIVGFIALLIFLVAIIVIPLTVWRVFKGTTKQFGDVFAQAEKIQKKNQEKDRETAVFQLASQQSGSVTAFQVTQHTDLTLTEATSYLEGLVRAGAAEMVVKETGTIEYRFALT